MGNGGNTDPGVSWWPATKRKQLLVSNENSTTMDSLVKFCDDNKLLKTPFVVADVTIPPENVPCFDFLVLFAIVVFLLFFLLIAYCCYRCRLKRSHGRCQFCGDYVKLGLKLMSHRVCCFNKNKLTIQSFRRHVSARCPSRNQPLYEWPKERGDKKFICGGTNCEEQGKKLANNGTERFHCPVCGYDLCSQCADAKQSSVDWNR